MVCMCVCMHVSAAVWVRDNAQATAKVRRKEQTERERLLTAKGEAQQRGKKTRIRQ